MHRSFIGFFTVVLASGLTACATEAPDAAGSGEPTAEVASASTASCTYTFFRDDITVIKGEGGAAPALELDVDTSALGSTVNFSGTIKVGASHPADATVVTRTVTGGAPVSIPWSVDATEFDTWDKDDHGSASGTMSFNCTGTGSVSDSQQIALGNAIIDVTVTASW